MMINEKAFEQARQIHYGIGWKGIARIMVATGLDRTFGVHGPRRIRKKKIYRLLQRAAFHSIFIP